MLLTHTVEAGAHARVVHTARGLCDCGGDLRARFMALAFVVLDLSRVGDVPVIEMLSHSDSTKVGPSCVHRLRLSYL